MTTLEWCGIGGVMIPLLTGQYFIIMSGVDGKIEKAMTKLKDEKIQELIRKNERLVAKNELLKDGLIKLK